MTPKSRRRKITDSYDSTRPYLIDAILPAHCLHLLGGPSGAGKTRWLFDLLRNWALGNSLFGFASHPVPWVYVATDRDYASACDTLRELEIDPETVDIYPAWDLEPPEGFAVAGFTWLLKQVRKEYPAAKLIVIETAAVFVPKAGLNDYAVIGKFCRDLGRYAKKNNLTILATHHTAKQKGKDKYENPREQLMGSGGWGGFTETTFIMDFAEPDNSASPYRRLTVMPRNGAPNMNFAFKFDKQGRLTQCNPNEIPKHLVGKQHAQNLRDSFMKFFASLPKENSGVFELKTVLEVLQNQAARRTIIRHIEEMCEEGKLERMAHGTYRLVGLIATQQFEGILL